MAYAAALSAALLALAPAAAGAATSVDVGKTCYAEGDSIAVEGEGFSPDANVRLALERADGSVLEQTSEPTSSSDGTVSGKYRVDQETGWFKSTQTRFQMTLRLTDLTDQTRAPATTSFIFSRWNVGVSAVGGRIHPARPVTLAAVGYTNAVGKALYAHWTLGSKRVFTKRLGVLRSPCGDLRKRLSRGFPFRPVRPGSYKVTFNSSATNAKAKDSIVHTAARVRRLIP